MTPLDILTFRTDLPEFSNITLYPDSAITFWLNYGLIFLNASRWKTVLNLGLEMYIAHNLVLEAYNQKAVAMGGLPGLNRGVISAEGADGVSVSYDTSAGLVLDAGHWNLTTYGTRFIDMAKRMGAGPIQVGVGCSPFPNNTPWFGPDGSLGH